METIDKTDREMTREEKRKNILKELYSHNLAERTRDNRCEPVAHNPGR